MDILENTALSLGKKIRQKEISVREAVKASLDQIDRQEPKIHAFLDVDEKKVYARVKEVEEGIKAGRGDRSSGSCKTQSRRTRGGFHSDCKSARRNLEVDRGQQKKVSVSAGP